MKKYTVVFRETREYEMQGVKALSMADAICEAEQIVQAVGRENWTFGQKNWTSRGLKVIDCRVERKEVK